MPFTIPPYIPEDIADWEGRYHILFERSELFMQKLCGLLEMPYEVTSEGEVLEKIEKLYKFRCPDCGCFIEHEETQKSATCRCCGTVYEIIPKFTQEKVKSLNHPNKPKKVRRRKNEHIR